MNKNAIGESWKDVIGESWKDVKHEFLIEVERGEIAKGSEKASDVIRAKLIDAGGTATIHTLQGKVFNITITADCKAFETKKLPQVNYGFEIFDVILDLLHENGGEAQKGNGRNFKLGEGKCGLDTVVGAIGYRYAKKTIGESVFDPVFVLAAILEWAKICHNEHGFLKLWSY